MDPFKTCEKFLVGKLASVTGANLKYVLLAPQNRGRGEHENSITGVEVTRSRCDVISLRGGLRRNSEPIAIAL